MSCGAQFGTSGRYCTNGRAPRGMTLMSSGCACLRVDCVVLQNKESERVVAKIKKTEAENQVRPPQPQEVPCGAASGGQVLTSSARSSGKC